MFGVYYSDSSLSFTISLKGRRKKIPQPEKINGEFPEQDSLPGFAIFYQEDEQVGTFAMLNNVPWV